MTGARPGPREFETLLDVLGGRGRCQAVSTAAALGLPELLAAGPRSAAELADVLDADPDGLERLLDFLQGLGFCRRIDAHRFVLTVLGQTLRQDQLGPLATFLGAPEQWQPWAALRDSLGAGSASAFERTHGRDLFDYLAQDAAASRRYDAAIDAFTRHETLALGEQFDFGPVATLVDVGGGRGAALRSLLTRWPHLRGVLFDLPHVVRAAGDPLTRDFPGRVDVVAGDFRRSVPGGADAYLLKHVLHNWDDVRAAELLARCAAAVAPGGWVLIIEAILVPHGRTDSARMLDLEMLVLTDGRERRKPELRRLLRGAGLDLQAVRPVTSGSWLLVGRRPAGPPA